MKYLIFTTFFLVVLSITYLFIKKIFSSLKEYYNERDRKREERLVRYLEGITKQEVKNELSRTKKTNSSRR